MDEDEKKTKIFVKRYNFEGMCQASSTFKYNILLNLVEIFEFPAKICWKSFFILLKGNFQEEQLLGANQKLNFSKIIFCFCLFLFSYYAVSYFRFFIETVFHFVHFLLNSCSFDVLVLLYIRLK